MLLPFSPTAKLNRYVNLRGGSHSGEPVEGSPTQAIDSHFSLQNEVVLGMH
jgi:hypothetical protein